MKKLLSLLLCLIVWVPSAQAAFVAAAHYDNVSSSSGVVTKPTGTADNDIMFTLIKRIGTTDPNSVPSGWTLVTTRRDLAGGSSFWLYWKLAASEGTDYTWGFAAAARLGITVYTYRGGFDTADPIDVVSDTAYITSNTTVRAATMTVTAANSVLLFFGGINQSSSITYTAPTVPTTFTEDVDQYSDQSRFGRTVASVVWTGSGATGSMDATASGTTVDKHAFAVALNPSAGSSSGLLLRRRRS